MDLVYASLSFCIKRVLIHGVLGTSYRIFEEDQDAEMAAGIDSGENQKLREKIDSSTEEMAEEFL